MKAVRSPESGKDLPRSGLLEPADGLRIDNVKRKFFITETKQDLNDGATQHLIGTHAMSACAMRFHFAAIQVLKNKPAIGSILINDVADDLQLLALGVIKNVVHKRHVMVNKKRTQN